MSNNLPEGITSQREKTTSIPTHDIEALAKGLEASSTGTRGHRIVAQSSAEEIGEVVYAYLPEPSVGFIGWVEVDPEYRRQGIGRTIRKSAVDNLLESGAQAVYSWPMSKSGLSLAEAENFEVTQVEGLNGWYVYK